MEKSESIAELSAALAKAQAAFQPVKRTAKVDFTTRGGQKIKYSYAPLSDVLDACRKALSDNALAIMQPTKLDGDKLVVETLLSHSSGQWIKSDIIINSADTSPQGIGSVLTYARRYSLSSLLGIAADEDDDANIASGHAAEIKQKEVAKDKLSSGGSPATKDHWCSVHNVAFFKTEKMRSYAHPVAGTTEWCYEKPKPAPMTEKAGEKPAEDPAQKDAFDKLQSASATTAQDSPQTAQDGQGTAQVNPSGKSPSKAGKAKIDPSTIKDKGDFFNACWSCSPEQMAYCMKQLMDKKKKPDKPVK